MREVREVARLLRSSGKVARVAKVREGKEGIRDSGFGRREQKKSHCEPSPEEVEEVRECESAGVKEVEEVKR